MTNTTQSSRHALLTRMLHGGLAIAIIVQLASSQFMSPDKGGNTAFEVHEYAGLAALAFVIGFWIFSLVRQRGTPVAELLPWASSARRAALWHDVHSHYTAFRQFKLPSHDGSSPLASSIHGLGLLLMTAMAASGTLYYFVNAGDPDAGGLVGAAMLIHKTLANLVWAYLIGHAGFGVLNHFGKTMSLRTMWSFKK
ncbi:MAG: cytochrome b/b6 domain-containing protein [Yoonia sp.]|nr:cytochrome b/b6 domain-containing protein [Yoonia sp.]